MASFGNLKLLFFVTLWIVLTPLWGANHSEEAPKELRRKNTVSTASVSWVTTSEFPSAKDNSWQKIFCDSKFKVCSDAHTSLSPNDDSTQFFRSVEEALCKVSGSDRPRLFLVLDSHGGPENFETEKHGNLKHKAFIEKLIHTIQSAKGVNQKELRVTFIYSACFSGSWVPHLQAAVRKKPTLKFRFDLFTTASACRLSYAGEFEKAFRIQAQKCPDTVNHPFRSQSFVKRLCSYDGMDWIERWSNRDTWSEQVSQFEIKQALSSKDPTDVLNALSAIEKSGYLDRELAPNVIEHLDSENYEIATRAKNALSNIMQNAWVKKGAVVSLNREFDKLYTSDAKVAVLQSLLLGELEGRLPEGTFVVAAAKAKRLPIGNWLQVADAIKGFPAERHANRLRQIIDAKEVPIDVKAHLAKHAPSIVTEAQIKTLYEAILANKGYGLHSLIAVGIPGNLQEKVLDQIIQRQLGPFLTNNEQKFQFSKKQEAQLLALLKDKYYRKNEFGLNIIAALSSNLSPDLVDALLILLKKDPKMYHQIADIIGKLGPNTKEVREALGRAPKEAKESADRAILQIKLRSLSNQGLLKILQEDKDKQWHEVVAVLLSRNAATPELLKSLSGRVFDPDSRAASVFVRNAGSVDFGLSAGENQIVGTALFDLAKQNKNPTLSYQAMKSISKRYSGNTEYFYNELLRAGMEGTAVPIPTLRLAYHQLQKAPSAHQARHFMSVLKNSKSLNAKTFAIRELEHQKEFAAPMLSTLFQIYSDQKSEQWWKDKIKQRRGESDLYENLSEEVLAMKASAKKAIVRLAHELDAKQVMPHLVLALNSPHESTRRLAAGLLAKLPGADLSHALNALRGATQDNNTWVRQYSAKALLSIFEEGSPSLSEQIKSTLKKMQSTETDDGVKALLRSVKNIDNQ